MQLESVAEGRESVVCVSAQTGEGVPELLHAIEDRIKKDMALVLALIPFKQVCMSPVLPASAKSALACICNNTPLLMLDCEGSHTCLTSIAVMTALRRFQTNDVCAEFLSRFNTSVLI